jgi:hypothetical protein
MTIVVPVPDIRVAHTTTPADEYLMRKPLVPGDESVAPVVPSALYIVSVPQVPLTNTLFDVSMAIACGVALPVLVLLAAHTTTPAEVYLATKQLLLLANASVAPVVPSALYRVSAAVYVPITNTLPLESVTTACALS